MLLGEGGRGDNEEGRVREEREGGEEEGDSLQRIAMQLDMDLAAMGVVVPRTRGREGR